MVIAWPDEPRSVPEIIAAESAALEAAGATLRSTEDLLRWLRSSRGTDP